jgi:hypothetical protein
MIPISQSSNERKRNTGTSADPLFQGGEDVKKRKSYQNTWSEIGDAYDKKFAAYVDKLPKEQSH